jgi:hypothetical protein
VQDVDAPVLIEARLREGVALGFLRHVGFETERLEAIVGDQLLGLLGGVEPPVDEHDLGPLTREEDRGGTSVADGLTGRLPGPHDDGDLVRKTHVRRSLPARTSAPTTGQPVRRRQVNAAPPSASADTPSAAAGSADEPVGSVGSEVGAANPAGDGVGSGVADAAIVGAFVVVGPADGLTSGAGGAGGTAAITSSSGLSNVRSSFIGPFNAGALMSLP